MRHIKLITFIIFTVIAALLFLIIAAVAFPWHKQMGPTLLKFYSRIVLMIFGVHIDSADKLPITDLKHKGVILVANHTSSLDIFLMSALYGTVFLSKEEVRQYPLIGLVARLIGIIFLRRHSPFDRHRVILNIARNSNGRIITIFPQGTTGTAEERLPFKRGIFKAVEINPHAVLLPVTIRYQDDREITWRRNQILIDNIKVICAQKKIRVKVTVHEPLTIADYADKKVSDICTAAQEKVFSRLQGDYGLT